MIKDINRFLNTEGLVVVWPKKHSDKLLILKYIIDKFEFGKTLSENEVNKVIKTWHTFDDWPLIRRSLVDAGMLTRDINGYKYQRSKRIQV